LEISAKSAASVRPSEQNSQFATRSTQNPVEAQEKIAIATGLKQDAQQIMSDSRRRNTW
jgi:xanthine dehydrogenase molybdopterin-binding subunit B